MGATSSLCSHARACVCRTNSLSALLPIWWGAALGSPPAIAPALSHGVLARLAEGDVGPALERELQIDARRSEIDERALVIAGEMLVGADGELFELARIGGGHPASG